MHRSHLAKILMKSATIAIALLVVMIVVGIAAVLTFSNRTQGQLSSCGKYLLTVPTTIRITRLEPVRMVTIQSTDGSLLHQDKDSKMFAGLNVYFGWDKQDRVWLYNSDDGGIWRWELVDGNWEKIRSDREDGIPEEILPSYAKGIR